MTNGDLQTFRDGAQEFADRYLLSPQETRLIRCLMAGKRAEESAEELGCKVQTLSSYWNRIFRKIGVRTQREILLRYIDALEKAALELRQSHGNNSRPESALSSAE